MYQRWLRRRCLQALNEDYMHEAHSGPSLYVLSGAAFKHCLTLEPGKNAGLGVLAHAYSPKPVLQQTAERQGHK